MGIVVGLAPVAQDTHAAWHDEHPGLDLSVHYVHLTGHDGDNVVNRRNLLADHQACVDQHTAFGQPASPLPPSGIPPVIVAEDVS